MSRRKRLLIPFYPDEDALLWAATMLRHDGEKITAKKVYDKLRDRCEGELSDGFFTGATDGDILGHLDSYYSEVKFNEKEIAAIEDLMWRDK